MRGQTHPSRKRDHANDPRGNAPAVAQNSMQTSRGFSQSRTKTSVEDTVFNLNDLTGILVDQKRIGPIAHPDVTVWRHIKSEVQEIVDPIVLRPIFSRQSFAITPATVRIVAWSAIITPMKATLGGDVPAEFRHVGHGMMPGCHVTMRVDRRTETISMRRRTTRRMSHMSPVHDGAGTTSRAVLA